MSGSEAEAIFERIKASHVDDLQVVIREDYCERVMNAFVHCLQGTSPIAYLSLSAFEGYSMSEKAFLTICSAIPDCPSLKYLILNGLVVENADNQKINTALSTAVLSSPSLTALSIHDRSSSTLSLDDMFRSLSRAEAVRRSDVTIRRMPCGGFRFYRWCWWKAILPYSIPLNFWPHILKKAHTYQNSATHSGMDVLYFLVKEKHTVLLQNVKRRRIRKRKRYAIDA